MNNKYFKYCLLLGVILVWGLIILNVVKGISPQKTVPADIKKEMVHIGRNLTDSFSLIQDYPDPFLPLSDSLAESDKLPVIANKSSQPVVSQDSLLRVRVNPDKL